MNDRPVSSFQPSEESYGHWAAAPTVPPRRRWGWALIVAAIALSALWWFLR